LLNCQLNLIMMDSFS